MHLPEQAPTPSRDSVSQPRDRFASWMLIACLLFAVGQLGFNAVTLDAWMDEGKYLMKGYWYFTGKIAPYSTVDPSFYMPLSFYSVAPMEWLFGVGYLPGRVLMIVFALGCLVLAMVSCLSLALVFVLLVVRSRVLAYGTSGIILWALVFTRPDMLPIAMIQPAGRR
jgi:hypothetical protein